MSVWPRSLQNHEEVSSPLYLRVPPYLPGPLGRYRRQRGVAAVRERTRESEDAHANSRLELLADRHSLLSASTSQRYKIRMRHRVTRGTKISAKNQTRWESDESKDVDLACRFVLPRGVRNKWQPEFNRVRWEEVLGLNLTQLKEHCYRLSHLLFIETDLVQYQPLLEIPSDYLRRSSLEYNSERIWR